MDPGGGLRGRRESKAAQKLAELLLAWGGRGDMEQIRTAFGAKDPDGAIRTLIDRGAAERITSAQRGIGDKKEKLAVLAMPAEEAMARVTPRRRTAPLRYSVTELLCQLGAAPAKELCYFTGASMPTVKSLEKSGHPHPGGAGGIPPSRRGGGGACRSHRPQRGAGVCLPGAGCHVPDGTSRRPPCCTG